MKEEVFLNVFGLIILIGVLFLVVIFFKLAQLGIKYDEECAKLNHMCELTKKDIEKNKKIIWHQNDN